MVQGIIIPADNTAPLRTSTLDSLEDYQRAVGGWIEAVAIPDLSVTMYVNEEGLIRDLPYNRRATFLWRFHVPQARDARLVGDVAVVGLTDNEGENTDLPSELRRRLLEPGVYRVRTRELGRSMWHEEPIDRDDYVETIIWAALLQEITPTLEVRIERVSTVLKARATSFDGGRWLLTATAFLISYRDSFHPGAPARVAPSPRGGRT